MALWTPEAIETDLWLDAADDITLIVEADDGVTDWVDKSTKGRDFAATDPWNSSDPRPTFQEAAVNGLNTIQFGTNQTMTAPWWSSPVVHSFFAVIDPPDTGDRKYVFSSGEGGNSSLLLVAARNDNEDVGYYDGDSWRGSAGATAGPQLLQWLFDDSAGVCEIYRNGNLLGSPTYSPQELNEGNESVVALGGRPANSDWFDGAIGEFILLHERIGDEDREKVEGYLAHKWGLESNLPSDHPYKSEPPEAPEPTFAGNATTALGDPVDHVVIYDWNTLERVKTVEPEANGEWESGPLADGEYLLTYLATGHQPITHGPYIVDENSE